MIVKNKNQFIGNLRIDLHEVFDTEEEAYIDIRDCTIEETIGFKVAEGDKEQISYLRELLPSVIVNHNFEDENHNKLSNDEVTDLIFSSPWYVAQEVYGALFKWMFRHRVGRS